MLRCLLIGNHYSRSFFASNEEERGEIANTILALESISTREELSSFATGYY